MTPPHRSKLSVIRSIRAQSQPFPRGWATSKDGVERAAYKRNEVSLPGNGKEYSVKCAAMAESEGEVVFGSLQEELEYWKEKALEYRQR